MGNIQSASVRNRLTTLGISLCVVSLFSVIIIFFIAKILTPTNPLLPYFGLQKPIIIGYLPYWMVPQVQKNSFSGMTEIAYFGLEISPDGTLKKLSTPQEEEPGWTTLKGKALSEILSAAKNNNIRRSLVTHLANEQTISTLLSSPVPHAQAFIVDVIPLLKSYQFTGLHIDIESFKNRTKEEQDAFIRFLSTVYETTQKEHIPLTIDVAPISLFKQRLIDPSRVHNYTDYIMLMTYDYHYGGSFLSGPVAPLGGAGDVREFDVQTSVTQALSYIPEEKIILGIPFYGYQWETIQKSPGAAVIPNSGKTASMKRIETLQASSSSILRGTDKESLSPYFIWDEADVTNQAYIEDAASIENKFMLAKQYKLAGVGFWALGYETESIHSVISQFKSSFWIR